MSSPNDVQNNNVAAQILVVDDERAIHQVLAAKLRKSGYPVEEACGGSEALERLQADDFEVVICDINMPGMNGVEVMRKAQEMGIDATFLLMTAFASVDTAVEAMKLGAFDYLVKPVNPEELLHQLAQIIDMRGLRSENRLLRSIVLGDQDKRCQLTSSAMQQVKRLVDKVAVTDSTVLITGESGTGKSVLARNIHRQSKRAAGPLIPVNCGAIPADLMESELFGHAKGAFTGADKVTKGLFAAADKGTIFLDEIGELPLALQVKLLHVIEDHEFRPVGSDKTRRVDVRIIAATNRDLDAMVRSGKFREDLFFRLNMIHITLPPLRERREDIRSLIQFYLARGEGQGKQLSIDPEAEAILMAYDWPGNAREVENVIGRAMILSDGAQIATVDLPSQITRTALSAGASQTGGDTLCEKMKLYEYQMIQQTVNEMGGDRRAAAERLGIGLSTLYRKLDELKPQDEQQA